MTYEKIVQTIRRSFFDMLLVGALLTIGFMAIEPVISHAIVSPEFLVTQVVSAGIAFEQNPGNVAMVGTLDGLTGGTSYGTSSVRVTTNNITGYNMTIAFSSTTAMNRNGSNEGVIIQNYQYSTGTAAYPTGFNADDTNVLASQFGFSVLASTTAEASDVFKSSGTTCGSGTFTYGDCWRGASTTDETGSTELIRTTAQTAISGSTSTVLFRIDIPNGPSPSVTDGTYTATATLTAVVN